jgi:hypothetical protein
MLHFKKEQPIPFLSRGANCAGQCALSAIVASIFIAENPGCARPFFIPRLTVHPFTP